LDDRRRQLPRLRRQWRRAGGNNARRRCAGDLRRRRCADRRRAAAIVAVGRSLGTGVAVKLAAARPLAGVVLASPYDSLVEVGRTHYPWLPVSLLLKHRFDAAADAGHIRAPLLAIVASSDSIMPEARSRALYEAWAGPKTWLVVPGTDHNTLSGPDAYWTALAAFLARVR
jgi:pimeloyl-ACP methyl ester carboxylesterase